MNQLWSAESSAVKVRFTRSPRWTVRFGPGVVIVALVNPQPSPASPWSVKFTGGRPSFRDGTGAAALAFSDTDEGESKGVDASAATRRNAEATSAGPRTSPPVIPPRVSFLQATTFRVAVIV